MAASGRANEVFKTVLNLTTISPFRVRGRSGRATRCIRSGGPSARSCVAAKQRRSRNARNTLTLRRAQISRATVENRWQGGPVLEGKPPGAGGRNSEGPVGSEHTDGARRSALNFMAERIQTCQCHSRRPQPLCVQHLSPQSQTRRPWQCQRPMLIRGGGGPTSASSTSPDWGNAGFFRPPVRSVPIARGRPGCAGNRRLVS